MLKTLILRIRASLDRFVRNHIVDDEENIWPGLTALEYHEQETPPRRLEVAHH
ncbi:MAG TPA: hypothetical protein VL426_01350 [Candidatus Binatia bacterium]|jgi:hypothetical protein|nr:hypothetical protein [Candidatus Binatia bacterium]